MLPCSYEGGKGQMINLKLKNIINIITAITEIPIAILFLYFKIISIFSPKDLIYLVFF